VGTGYDFTWHALNHFDAGALQSLDLLGIVRKQAYTVCAKCFQHLSGQRKVAMVGFKAQPFVGFHCVETRVLQFISL